MILFQTFFSFLIYFSYNNEIEVKRNIPTSIIHFDDSISSKNKIQTNLNNYVQFISKFDYLSSSIKYKANITMNGMLFKIISKELIINTLSNKVIVLFGDSLNYYLTAYILHVIHWCIDGNIKQCRCKTFCDHLENDSIPLILNECEEDILNRREYLERKLPDFDGYHRNSFKQNSKSMVYFKKYNITIYLYYKWSEDMNGINELIDDALQYDQYHIMINNLLNMHWTIFRKESFNTMWNYNVSIAMLNDMEYYMDKLIENNNNKCLIFGPVNPWFYFNAELIRWLKKAVFPLILKRCKYFTDNIDWFNLNKTDKDSLIKLSKIMSSPQILQCIDCINNGWNNHLNYLWSNMDDNWYSNFSLRVYWCRRSIIRMRRYKGYKYKDNDDKIYENMINNVCLLYHQGLGQTLIAERMKDYITNLDIKYIKSNVYYHDQYMLYHSFKRLSDYIVHAIHYPRLVPIAWNNLLNIIANGC